MYIFHIAMVIYSHVKINLFWHLRYLYQQRRFPRPQESMRV